jgi:aryl-alcohol dehydrogenase-like predicted oxidoreductase
MRAPLPPVAGLPLSAVGFGAWTISRTWWGDDHDDARAVRTIHAALDQGINWVDTAPLYGQGHGDRLVREALKGRPEVMVATKVGVIWEGTASGHAESRLDRATIQADCEASLERLGRDRIDLLQVHWPCQHSTPLAETVSALDALVEQGKVRAWGVCNYSAPGLAALREHGRPASLQTPLSLVRREAEGGLLAAAAEGPDPVAVLAYETLCRGLLSGRFRSLPHFPETDQRARDERFQGRRFAHARALLDDLERVSKRIGIPLPTLAVGWVLSRKGVRAAIVGARTPEQVVATARAARLSPTAKVWTVVDRIAALHGGL